MKQNWWFPSAYGEVGSGPNPVFMSSFHNESSDGVERGPDISPIMQGTEADKAADYANYFCSYSYLYHQKQMLMDHVRMKAYHSAIMKNKVN